MTTLAARGTWLWLPVLLAGALIGQAATQADPSADFATAVSRLANLDHSTRMHAARIIRRAPASEAVVTLTAAVRQSSDQYVRYRALVLLTGFNDRATNDLMRGLLGDRNDRIREIAYRWIAAHPDPVMTLGLLAAVDTEVAEFVRPALMRALAAHAADPQVRRVLLAETARGLDFFRSAVIEVLGLSKAGYAVDTLMAIARIDGPLQDDAVLALGRIGDPRALALVTELPAAPPDLVMSARASRCLLGDDCTGQIAALIQAMTVRTTRSDASRAAAAALSVLAAGSDAALAALATTPATSPVHQEAAVAFGGAALRDPARVLGWLVAAPEDQRGPAIEALREAFDRFEEDLAEEQFFAATRAEYWKAPDGSPVRPLMATIIQKLEF